MYTDFPKYEWPFHLKTYGGDCNQKFNTWTLLLKYVNMHSFCGRTCADSHEDYTLRRSGDILSAPR